MPVQSEHVGTVTMRKTFAMDDGDDDPDDATSNNFLRVQAACILRVFFFCRTLPWRAERCSAEKFCPMVQVK